MEPTTRYFKQCDGIHFPFGLYRQFAEASNVIGKPKHFVLCCHPHLALSIAVNGIGCSVNCKVLHLLAIKALNRTRVQYPQKTVLILNGIADEAWPDAVRV